MPDSNQHSSVVSHALKTLREWDHLGTANKLYYRQAIDSLEEQLEAERERVTFWKNQARRARMTDGICGVIVDSSWHEPVACALGPDHEGDHSWASIPARNPASEPTPLQRAYGGKVRTVNTDPSNQASDPKADA